MRDSRISGTTAKLAQNAGLDFTEKDTQSLLQKYLRDIENYSVLIYLDTNIGYYFKVYKTNPREEPSQVKTSMKCWDLYEQALESGLQFVLKLMK